MPKQSALATVLGGREYPRCIASDEVCGYRNKPAAPPNPNLGLVHTAPCHELPIAYAMELLRIECDETTSTGF